MNAAELIINPDGSAYHLHLLPEDIAPVIILVGDQNRVPMVSRYFDRIDVQKQKREFFTHTGWIGQKRITVLSTGIGPDNIDIVINELDALANIDFATREIKEKLTSLSLVRIGTCGSIHPEVNSHDVVVSGYGVGMDTLGNYYPSQKLQHPLLPPWSYIAQRHAFNLESFPAPYREGITLTCPGFYGPQGRSLRMPLTYRPPIDELHKEKINGLPYTNLEMETSTIYLMAAALGHKAISFNTVLANRLKGHFSVDPEKAVDHLIQSVLTWIEHAVD
jgi:uridine phosphorylase